jgi:hypothetical protein
MCHYENGRDCKTILDLDGHDQACGLTKVTAQMKLVSQNARIKFGGC